jgi:hypothetical protein
LTGLKKLGYDVQKSAESGVTYIRILDITGGIYFNQTMKRL